MRISQGIAVLCAVGALTLAVVSVGISQSTKPEKAPKAESKPASKESKTLEDLMKAYEGESNAHAGYAEFAKKADEEGYGQVASLFRAASASEKVHAQREADAIKKLGGTPKAEIQKADVKSTKENLEAALKGETYEKDTMYPEFLKAARAANDKLAIEAFNYAKAAETEHASFYKQALDKLDQWKGGSKVFYVCRECGRTATELPEKKCPVCFKPVSEYEKIS